MLQKKIEDCDEEIKDLIFEETIETFITFMENLERCICIFYDDTAATTGALGLKAIRLTDNFVEAYREGAAAQRAGRCTAAQGAARAAGHPPVQRVRPNVPSLDLACRRVADYRESAGQEPILAGRVLGNPCPDP